MADMAEELQPIAIIGLAFRFPQDTTSEAAFWQMLYEGRSASTEFPRDRLNIDAYYHPDEARPSTVSPASVPKFDGTDRLITIRYRCVGATSSMRI